jgi:hypothetical protein
LGQLRAGCDEAEGADWAVSADPTVVRADRGGLACHDAPPPQFHGLP